MEHQSKFHTLIRLTHPALITSPPTRSASSSPAPTQILAAHPAYTDTVTAALRDTFWDTSFEGDPYKFAETLYRMVVGAGDGKKIPLFLPIGEDALGMLQDRVRRMGRVVVDASPWSTDLKKDMNKDKAKL
ncbi:hypothetical protein J3R83DRAFT_11954 [Lanmaoa asiatica]|nr:hypothetical protein J3R83DRAFT_11954 [Lanmaoa asiatica]